VLELGSGTGIVGLTAAALGARVVLSDLPEVLPALAASLEQNRLLIAAAGGSADAIELNFAERPPEAAPAPEDAAAAPSAAASVEGGQSGAAAAPAAAPPPPASPAASGSYDGGDGGGGGGGGALDWVLGSDLVYAASSAPGLVDLLARLAAANPRCRFLLGHKHRSDEVDAALFGCLAAARASARPLPSDGGPRATGAGAGALYMPDDSSYKRIVLYEIVFPGSEVAAAEAAAAAAAAAAPAAAPAAPVAPPPRRGAVRPLVPLSLPAAAAGAGAPAPPSPPPLYLLPDKKVLLLGCGLPAAGKSVALRALAAAVANSTYVDKDGINQALLGDAPYFGPYYATHVRQQTYAVSLRLAADALSLPGPRLVVLDGQYGDKLSAPYIAGPLAALAAAGVEVKVAFFGVSAAEQERRMRARGEPRDAGKYAAFGELRAAAAAANERELSRLPLYASLDAEAPAAATLQALLDYVAGDELAVV